MKKELLRYFLELSYHGGHYHGWQRQPNAISIQEVLEKALSTLLRTPIAIVGAGRTDAGVHAQQMYAHFDAELESKFKELPYQLNQFLPWNIAVKDLHPVQHDAHARFAATARTYEYRILSNKSVFAHGMAYFYKQPLDIASMNAAAKILMEYNNFECFSKVNTDVKTFFCKITHAHWIETENGFTFTITADRFLRNMVRAIVGTLIEVGQNKKSLDDFRKLIESKDRSQAGFSAPAQGLFLNSIAYPKTIFDND